jgi:tRNA(Ile2) C34 agmatinyltransferase TiaS
MKEKICRTCGRAWVSSDLDRWKGKPEKEPPICPICNGKMKISGTGWVSWKCAECGYSSGLEYCSEYEYPKDLADLRYHNRTS